MVDLTMIVYIRWRGENDMRWLLIGLVSWPILCVRRGLFMIMAFILLSVYLTFILRIKLKFVLLLYCYVIFIWIWLYRRD